MTIDEYRRALHRLSDDELQKFNDDFGGGQKTREQRVREFVENQEHERRICDLLGLIPQDEKAVSSSTVANRISVASAVIAVVACFTTLWTWNASHSLSRQQLALAATPHIEVLPTEVVEGDIGKFQLTLLNPGPADLDNVRVYEDYFVSLTPPDGTISFHRFGAFVTEPTSVIERLESGDEKAFEISFSAIHEDMNKFYRSDMKGHRMKLARLKIKFRRVVDGAQFERSKLYIIAGHGDHLFDHDERGMNGFGGPTLAQVKIALGVDED